MRRTIGPHRGRSRSARAGASTSRAGAPSSRCRSATWPSTSEVISAAAKQTTYTMNPVENAREPASARRTTLAASEKLRSRGRGTSKLCSTCTQRNSATRGPRVSSTFAAPRTPPRNAANANMRPTASRIFTHHVVPSAAVIREHVAGRDQHDGEQPRRQTDGLLESGRRDRDHHGDGGRRPERDRVGGRARRVGRDQPHTGAPASNHSAIASARTLVTDRPATRARETVAAASAASSRAPATTTTWTDARPPSRASASASCSSGRRAIRRRTRRRRSSPRACRRAAPRATVRRRQVRAPVEHPVGGSGAHRAALVAGDELDVPAAQHRARVRARDGRDPVAGVGVVREPGDHGGVDEVLAVELADDELSALRDRAPMHVPHRVTATVVTHRRHVAGRGRRGPIGPSGEHAVRDGKDTWVDDDRRRDARRASDPNHAERRTGLDGARPVGVHTAARVRPRAGELASRSAADGTDVRPTPSAEVVRQPEHPAQPARRIVDRERDGDRLTGRRARGGRTRDLDAAQRRQRQDDPRREDAEHQRRDDEHPPGLDVRPNGEQQECAAADRERPFPGTDASSLYPGGDPRTPRHARWTGAGTDVRISAATSEGDRPDDSRRRCESTEVASCFTSSGRT